MKTYIYFSILMLVAAAAYGSEPIQEEASMKANGRLEVSNVAGSVEIEGWSKKKIEVTGKLGDDSRLIFDVDGKTAVVEVEFDQEHSRKKHYNLDDTDLVIRVPHSTRVSASTVSADLVVKEIQGEQRLQTVSGDLDARVFEQEAIIKSVSGDIDIVGDGSQSQLTVASVSGDVDVEGVAGEISAKTVSGDVEVDAQEFERLELGSVSGDLVFSGNLKTGGRIEAESVSGDIQLDLDSLFNTEYYLESFSGSIRPVLGHKATKTSKYAPGSKLALTEGDGQSRIRVETMSGDIEINATVESRKKPKVQQTSSLGSQSGQGLSVSMEELGLEMEELARVMQLLADDGRLDGLEISLDDIEQDGN